MLGDDPDVAVDLCIGFGDENDKESKKRKDRESKKESIAHKHRCGGRTVDGGGWEKTKK